MKTPRVSSLRDWVLPLAATVLLCVGCASGTMPGSPSTSASASASASLPDHASDSVVELQVQLYPNGKKLGSEFTLECVAGEVSSNSGAPDPDGACAAIARNPLILTPQRPANQACTEIYGGPARAIVQGTRDGKSFSSEFTRSNGCFIAQWDALSTLLGVGEL